jgi:hypothetical protein
MKWYEEASKLYSIQGVDIMQIQRIPITLYTIGIAVLLALAVMPFLNKASSVEGDLEDVNPDKLALVDPGASIESDSPITYIAELFDGHPAAVGAANFRSIFSPGLWDYYYFYAVAGDSPVIEVHRLTSQMDPAMTLFFGTTDDSNGLGPWGSTQPGMTFLAFRDDEIPPPHGVGGWYWDPRLSGYILPSTGEYTLAVYDCIGMGPPGPDGRVPYHILISGITRPVEVDVKPGSDPNSINPGSTGVIPVAILTTDDFDATTVDGSTVEFGPGGAEPVHKQHGHIEDVNGDSRDDWIGHFRTQDVALAAGDTTAVILGRTEDGNSFRGEDSVNIVGRAAPPAPARSRLTTTWARVKSE